MSLVAYREHNVTQHVARNVCEFPTNTGKRVRQDGVIDRRMTRHPGHAESQIVRKVIETLFYDDKHHGATIRQIKLRGRDKVSDVFTIAILAGSLRRLPNLFAAQTAMAGSG